jgi:hypothetical protein
MKHEALCNEATGLINDFYFYFPFFLKFNFFDFTEVMIFSLEN